MRLHTLKGNISIGTTGHYWSLALNPVGQGCLRPDASHAGRRPRHGETFQPHLRSAPLGQRSHLQCPARSAELGNDLDFYRGSYILAFVAYNAGRGRARDWIAQYGDPRDPKVDPIDWIERIPISETRFYIQRVLENMQVYRARFDNGSRLLIDADLRRGS
jgi:hypothetical protein